MRTSRFIAWAGALVLLALHFDFWRPQRVVLYFGWMPEEILYRLAWMFFALVYLIWFCSRVWTDSKG